jgi:hypothetical protein
MNDDLKKMNLVGLTDLSKEWGVSRQRAQIISQNDSFPEPIITATGPTGKIIHRLWLHSEATEWRRKQMRGR